MKPIGPRRPVLSNDLFVDGGNMNMAKLSDSTADEVYTGQNVKFSSDQVIFPFFFITKLKVQRIIFDKIKLISN